MTERIKRLLSLVAGIVSAFSRQYGAILLFVCIAIIFDWITGVIGSLSQGEKLSSKKGKKGFWKKMAFLLALCFGIFIDYFIPYAITRIGVHIDANTAIFGMVIGCYIVINESISICENLYKINPAILPNWIIKMLISAKEQIDKKGDVYDEKNSN